MAEVKQQQKVADSAVKHGLLAKEAIPENLQALQEKEDPTDEDLDAEIAAAKAAATTKSGRALGRSFGFRSKKALHPAAAADDADKDEEGGDAAGAAAKAPQ